MKRLALTLDDGPSQWTPEILDLLDDYNAKATFFVLGANIPTHEKTVKRIIAEGHELGVHGFDHKPVDELSYGQVSDQLAATCELLMRAGVTEIRWWRPPWHRVTKGAAQAAEALGLSYCGVTVDTHDVNRSTDRICKAVYDELADNGIVGLHDGIASNGNHETPHRKNTVRAIERILVTLDEQWSFVTVSELLG